MTNRTKFYIFILLVGVALTAWALFFKDQSGNIAGEELENEIIIGQDEDEAVADDKLLNYLEGRLEKSDNPSKGNLKLVSSLGEIYIKTERDFGALIGSDVLLFIKGTLDNFELLTIEKRFEKDGYIQSL